MPLCIWCSFPERHHWTINMANTRSGVHNAHTRQAQVAAGHISTPMAICLPHGRHITPRNKDSKTPTNLFTKQTRPPKARYHHTFGCPAYILHQDLQGSKKINKWIERERVGINLGPSPKHESTVSLILNQFTGFVSPQFHVKHYDLFKTVTDGPTNDNDGHWRDLAQFRTTQTKKNANKKASATPLHPDAVSIRVEHLPESHLDELTQFQIMREGMMPILQRFKRIQELKEQKRRIKDSDNKEDANLSFAAQSEADIRAIHRSSYSQKQQVNNLIYKINN